MTSTQFVLFGGACAVAALAVSAALILARRLRRARQQRDALRRENTQIERENAQIRQRLTAAVAIIEKHVAQKAAHDALIDQVTRAYAEKHGLPPTPPRLKLDGDLPVQHFVRSGVVYRFPLN